MTLDMSPMRMGRRVLQREAERWWWLPLIGALIWFVIAWLVLRANVTSLATVGVLVGVVFVIAAANECALAALMRGGWAVLHVMVAVVFLLGGVWAFARPVNTFFALASMVGLLVLLKGGFTMMRGIALHDVSPYWWTDLVSGALQTGLGLWVSTSDRVWTLGARATFVLLWVGFMATFHGLSDLGLAFSLRQFGHDDGRRQWRETRVHTPAPAGEPRATSEPTWSGETVPSSSRT
jgi:uncharacterized membrane protein HdeD (DUF308 family)